MMSASNYKGYQRATKTVTIEGITDETDEQVADFAMRFAGERRSSLFGLNVNRDEHDSSTATVAMHTD